MWTSTTMTIPESLILSAMGILTVLSALAALAIIIMIFSKIMVSGSHQQQTTAAAPVVEAPEVGISEETAAMIISVICEEMNAKPEEIDIRSIRELA